MSDERDELEHKRAEASAEARTWKALMEHPSWPRYVEELEKQMKLRQVACMMTPIHSEYTAFAQEFYKGEFTGIKSMLELPAARHEAAEQQVTILTKQLENEDEAEAEVLARTRSRVDTDDHFGS